MLLTKEELCAIREITLIAKDNKKENFWSKSLTKKLRKLVRNCCGNSASVAIFPSGYATNKVTFKTKKGLKKFSSSFQWKELDKCATAHGYGKSLVTVLSMTN